MPLWVLIITHFTAPAFFDPLTTRHFRDVEFRLGAAVLAFEMFWMLIGAYVLWGARSVLTQAFVYVVFTIPATAVVLVSPAVVLILHNLVR